MNQDNVQTAISTLQAYFYGKHPTLEDVDKFANDVLKILFSRDEVFEAIRQYKINCGITMDPGELLTIKHQDDDWYEEYKNESSHSFEYSKRYEQYLKIVKKLSESVIKSTIKNNELTIKNFADPNSTDIVSRKGLVVGDVQAGKTLNYIGLINRAVDCGYKNIILLTGTTEELRKQTQERIDEGFVGCRSETLLTDNRTYVGVSLNEKKYYAITLTTYERDFSVQASKNMAFKLSDFDKSLPKIFVIKKNTHVLKEIYKLISKEDSSYLSRDSLLIIDDECDYASLNTKSEEDPTAINKEIRKILKLYSKSTYVGYSATPYANIFVNPEAQYEENEDGQPVLPDLFPSDFIVLLESPKNYIGAKDMFMGFDETYDDFGEIKHVGRNSDYIHLIGDHYDKENQLVIDNNFLPPKHKKDFPYTNLADSLKKAIKVFILSSCVYSLRGYQSSHRTMLVNISRFNCLQEEIGHHVRNYIQNLKYAINGSIRMSSSYFNSRPMLNDLESIWNEDIAFSRGSSSRELPPNKEFQFSEIKEVLQSEIEKMEVFVVNNQHKKDRLDYKKYEKVGVRGIVIGGFTLSRGLTLIGLMTSYYSRNAMAYDTLIQMGRWFGYRDGYDDLINIYMPQTSIDAFCAASDASEDLKAQFRHMAEEHKKPIDFGLMVREAPTTLENIPLVTARNKMKDAKDYVRSIVLTGKSIDTSKIFKSKEINEKNGELILSLLKQLGSRNLIYKEGTKPYYKNISKEIICDFLDHFHISDANKLFDGHTLSDYIRGSSSLDNWFIIVAYGFKNLDESKPWNTPRSNGLPFPFDGPCVKRSFSGHDDNPEEDFFRVGKGNNTIVDPNIYTTGLSIEEIKDTKDKYRKETGNENANPGSAYWLSKRQNPFLIIYPIDLKPTEKSENKTECYSQKKDQIIHKYLGNSLIYGLALGFHGQSTQVLKVRYNINTVKQKQMEEENDIDEDEDESEEKSV